MLQYPQDELLVLSSLPPYIPIYFAPGPALPNPLIHPLAPLSDCQCSEGKGQFTDFLKKISAPALNYEI